MKLHNRIERKLGRFAIPHLMYYLIALNAFGIFLDYVKPDFFNDYLCLDAYAILHGQVWRIITFVIQPPSSSSIFWSIIMLYIYFLIGSQLENIMGSFKFDSYIFMGMLLHVVAAIIAYLITGISFPIGTNYLYLSFFFIYAMAFPNAQFLLFFLLPVRGKWIAVLDGFYFAWAIVQAFLPAYGGQGGIYVIYYGAGAIAAFASLVNALIYYLTLRDDFKVTYDRLKRRQKEQMKKMAEELKRRENQRDWQGQQGPYAPGASPGQNPASDTGSYSSQTAGGQNSYSRPSSGQNSKEARHRCTICGRTELTNPELDFRYCSKCNGNFEYCSDHLFSHEHVK